MGLFVYFRGEFECIRCRHVSEAWIQTKFLRHDADNSMRPYKVGDSEVLDGLDGYYPLLPWNGQFPLSVIVGDWDCEHCDLNWQWAKAVFDVQPVATRSVATIQELSAFHPIQATSLHGVHFVEPDLANLSGLWGQPPTPNWSEWLAKWHSCAIEERCERVAAGFRLWCREVAGIE